MSDTLPDLASWLPSEFPTHHENKTHNHFLFPTDFPYEFASSSSTESESDDDDVPGLTRRFSRSVSLQERLKVPFPPEKSRVFSCSPESTLNWANSGPNQVRSSQATPFVQADEDAWGLIYAAAGQIARMKMRMDNANDEVFSNRGLLGSPRPLQQPLSRHLHSKYATWRSENEEFIRQQLLAMRVAGGVNYGGGGRCVAGRPISFCQPAWPPLPVENQRRQQTSYAFVVKPVPGGSGVGTAVVKRECAGTGVFLPRRYSADPPGTRRKPACSPAQLPARVAPSIYRTMDPIIRQAQPNKQGGFAPHYDTVMTPSNSSILAHQRRIYGHPVVPEPAKPHPEVVLPQEWTY